MVLIDAPLEPTQPIHEWTREFPDGLLTFRSEYHASQRIMHLNPKFRTQDGTTIELYDPYDPIRSNGQTGVWRYLYSSEELKQILKDLGFTVINGEHCSASDHYLLVAHRESV